MLFISILAILYIVGLGIVYLSKNEKTPLQLYLESKNPQSAADIDHYIREFTRRNHLGY